MKGKFIKIAKNNVVNAEVPTLTSYHGDINIKPELSLNDKDYKKVIRQMKKFRSTFRIL